jgi:hypothetical protein
VSRQENNAFQFVVDVTVEAAKPNSQNKTSWLSFVQQHSVA